MNDYVTRPEFQKVITVLERIEDRLTAVDERLTAVDERIRRQGVLHERLESKVDAVIEVLGTKASKSDVENLRAEIIPRLDLLESAMRAR